MHSSAFVDNYAQWNALCVIWTIGPGAFVRLQPAIEYHTHGHAVEDVVQFYGRNQPGGARKTALGPFRLPVHVHVLRHNAEQQQKTRSQLKAGHICTGPLQGCKDDAKLTYKVDEPMRRMAFLAVVTSFGYAGFRHAKQWTPDRRPAVRRLDLNEQRDVLWAGKKPS